MRRQEIRCTNDRRRLVACAQRRVHIDSLFEFCVLTLLLAIVCCFRWPMQPISIRCLVVLFNCDGCKFWPTTMVGIVWWGRRWCCSIRLPIRQRFRQRHRTSPLRPTTTSPTTSFSLPEFKYTDCLQKLHSLTICLFALVVVCVVRYGVACDRPHCSDVVVQNHPHVNNNKKCICCMCNRACVIEWRSHETNSQSLLFFVHPKPKRVYTALLDSPSTTQLWLQLESQWTSISIRFPFFFIVLEHWEMSTASSRQRFVQGPVRHVRGRRSVVVRRSVASSVARQFLFDDEFILCWIFILLFKRLQRLQRTVDCGILARLADTT